jgi:hypothetical protein
MEEYLINQKILDKLVFLLTEEGYHIASDSEEKWIIADKKKENNIYEVVCEGRGAFIGRSIIYQGSDLLIALKILEIL